MKEVKQALECGPAHGHGLVHTARGREVSLWLARQRTAQGKGGVPRNLHLAAISLW